jgi:hypothetical protein
MEAATAGREPGSARLERLLESRVCSGVLLALTGVTVGSAAAVALTHIRDLYHVNFVSGSLLALAADARHGDLYPAIFDGRHVGGTRYMPFTFLPTAAGELLVKNEILAGKLVALVTFVALIVLAFIAIRRQLPGQPGLVAALTGSIVVCETGFFAATAIRGDALPVVLQLGALLLLTANDRRGGSASRAAVVAAGVLCGAAPLAKTSALWGLGAGAIWLLVRERRRLLEFLGAAALVVVGGVLIVEAASSGRFGRQLAELTFAGSNHGSTPLLSALSVLRGYAHTAPYLLAPVALVVIVCSVARRQLSVFELALVIEALLLLVVYDDVGADFNHLIDAAVLLPIVAARAWTLPLRGSRLPAQLLLLVSAVLSLGVGWWSAIRPVLAESARQATGHEQTPYSFARLRPYVPTGAKVLSQDPTVPLERGRNPVVLDPFMAARLVHSNSAVRSFLLGTIRTGAYDRILLLLPPSDRAQRRREFEVVIAPALDAAYALRARVALGQETLWVYGRRG